MRRSLVSTVTQRVWPLATPFGSPGTRSTGPLATPFAAFLGVDGDPKGVASGPVDLVPGGLNFLGNFDGFATAENIKSGAVSDDHPVFPDAHAAHGGRAESARNFRDAPQRGFVDAIILRGMQRVFLHKIKP